MKFAPIITPHDPSKIDMVKLNQPPSSEHIFGTDSTGRDIFSRLLYGGSTGEGFWWAMKKENFWYNML